MTDEYATDRRVALDLNRVQADYERHYFRVCSSTQAEAKRLLSADGQAPMVVIAEEQSEGRGRLARSWTAPPFSSVLMSVVLPLPEPTSAFTPRVGVIVADALIDRGIRARLKWPNDIVVEVEERLRKLGGILAEVHRDHVIVGIGVNIDLEAAELPTPDAISCRQLGPVPDREQLIAAIANGLFSLPARVSMLRYRDLCVTIGADVEVARVAGDALYGRAHAVDDAGALLLVDDRGLEHCVTVGDVRHVRGRGI